MMQERYVIKDGKKLKMGYTTGSCAAAAAQAAASWMFGGVRPQQVKLVTPKGIELFLDVSGLEECDAAVQQMVRNMLEEREAHAAGKVSEGLQNQTWYICGIQKEAGDDPDVTDQAVIFAAVRKSAQPGISIDGGFGIGRVTKPGLQQPVGAAAINDVPRKMIRQEILRICEKAGYDGGIQVLLFVPEGEELAKHTFNPNLGIVGGISILGTSGIVMPMSESALLESMALEIRMKAAAGRKNLLVTPGNYGEMFVKRHGTVDDPSGTDSRFVMEGTLQDKLAQLDAGDIVKCSNFVGKFVEMALNEGIDGILFVAHIGKFIKVSGGIMDTHSHFADCRCELLCAHALRAGADADMARSLLEMNTTEEALVLLKENGLLDGTVQYMMAQIDQYLKHRTYGKLETAAIVFSSRMGYLGHTKKALELALRIRDEQGKTEDNNTGLCGRSS